MAYKHGVYTSEQATSMSAPITGTAGLQVIVGTAPVNMLKNPAAAVNVPLLVHNYKEAVEAVGYNADFAKYTLCECISANFSVVGVAPMVLINAIDGYGGNIAAATAVGKLVAERALEKGIDTVVFDRGGYLYHGRVKALAEGAREGGLKF